jgi:aspartate aminotransferase-like enzyme
VTMSDETTAHTASTHETDALLSRLRVIEDQPLDARADAYVHVHEQLQAELEGGDSSHR